MSGKTNFIIALVASILFSSCLPKGKNNNELEEQKFNLEKYLIKAGYTKIKMKKMFSGHLHLFAKLNGVDGNFILDTGAGGTMIEEKYKNKFKMQTREGYDTATGAGGQLKIQNSENNIIKIDDIELREQKLSLMSLAHINNAFERLGLKKVDGIIGADILKSGEAIIDYKNLNLYLKKDIINKGKNTKDTTENKPNK